MSCGVMKKALQELSFFEAEVLLYLVIHILSIQGQSGINEG